MVKLVEENAGRNTRVDLRARVVSSIAVDEEMSDIVLAEAAPNFVLFSHHIVILLEFTDLLARAADRLEAEEHDPV